MKDSRYYTINIEVPKDMDSKEARKELTQAIYQVSCLFYESIGEAGRLTDNKRLFGNGHHMAQDIAEKAGKLWDERLEDKKTNNFI